MNLSEILSEMSKRCYEEVFSGNEEHFPMLYIRYNNHKEKKLEFYYICRSCISKFLLSHLELLNGTIEILRGKPTAELEELIHKRWEQEVRKGMEKRIRG